jgi:plastocyanin
MQQPMIMTKPLKRKMAAVLTVLVTTAVLVNIYSAYAQQETKASIVSGAPMMGDKAFSPNPIQTKVGDTIIWTNNDSVPHTVTSGTGPNDPNMGKDFDVGISTPISPGSTFSHKFTTAGEFPYFCQIHPTMVGNVIVS